MTSQAVAILLPVGRMVYGNPYRPRTVDRNGRPLLIKTGPDAGKTRTDYGMGIAIPKTSPVWWGEPWGQLIYQVAAQASPQNVQQAVAQIQAGRDPGKFFSFKIIDGDSTEPNEAGRRPCDQEGFKGHWIVKVGSSYAPRIVTKDGMSPITEPDVVKAGHYVQAYVSVKGNDSKDSPGIYINHVYIAHAGYGPEIMSGPDPSTLGFGQGVAPAGMSAIPVGTMVPPATVVPPVAAVPGLLPPPVTVNAMVPPPVAAPAAVLPPPTPVTPHTAFLAPQTIAPPPPVVVVPPAPPAGPVMTPKATATYDQYRAGGWSDDQLRQHGLMV